MVDYMRHLAADLVPRTDYHVCVHSFRCSLLSGASGCSDMLYEGAARNGQIVTLRPVKSVLACDCYHKGFVLHTHARVIVDAGLTTPLTLP